MDTIGSEFSSGPGEPDFEYPVARMFYPIFHLTEYLFF